MEKIVMFARKTWSGIVMFGCKGSMTGIVMFAYKGIKTGTALLQI